MKQLLNLPKGRRIRAAAVFALLLGQLGPYAADSRAEDTTPAKYSGAGSCASSNCHGSVAPRSGSHVLLNEYTTWSKHDPHSKAFKSLEGDDARRMASLLGIGAPDREPMCLTCHSSFVRERELRGELQAEDGVTCETCHGAAERWLGPHAAHDATHANNVALGMTDLASIDNRSKLCVSCHQGTEDKVVNHRLIGAGHPRLSFEQDTFESIEPRHWVVDEDYISRKGDYVPTRAWLLGQITTAENMLGKMRSAQRSKSGIFPEFTQFYCSNCHHSLVEEQWKKREYGGQPGFPRPNLSAFVVVREALAVLDKKTGNDLEEQLTSLHQSFAIGGPAPVRAMSNVERILHDKGRSIAHSGDMSAETKRAILARLARLGLTTPTPPYEVAEQIAMGVSTIANDLSPQGGLYKNELEQMFAALKEPRDFHPEPFTKAAARIAGTREAAK